MNLLPKSLILATCVLAPLSLTLGEDEPPVLYCPDPAPCNPQSLILPETGSGCATIVFTPLVSYPGEATDACSVTCKTCSLAIRLTVNCSGCDPDCTYIWQVDSYDRAGNALDPEFGTGTTSGSLTVRQTVSSNCDGETATFGVSVAGKLGVINVWCEC